MKIPFKVLPEGLYCPSGDFFIDAWRPVKNCVITHGHGDHARWGHQQYFCSKETLPIICHRLGDHIKAKSFEYGKKYKFGETWVSLHPAGHILGSSQVRVETAHGVFVISGDYKRAPDPSCLPFECVECDVYVTETTFALPIYQWENPKIIAKQIYDWWQENSRSGHPSVLFCYALGKAQHVMALLKEFTDQPVYVHGAITPLAQIYKDLGISMIPFIPVTEKPKSEKFSNDLIIAPPSTAGSLWLKRFPTFRTAAASGWMSIRGMRKRASHDNGFVLSDHADWNELIKTVTECKAKQVLTTHGYTDVFTKFLNEELKIQSSELKGLEAMTEEDVG